MFGKRDSSKKTAIYFTEAWVFNNSNAGRSIIAAMARVGRSQMNQLVLDTQFIGDLGSDKEKILVSSLLLMKTVSEKRF